MSIRLFRFGELHVTLCEGAKLASKASRDYYRSSIERKPPAQAAEPHAGLVVKRVLDIVGSLLALVFLGPLLIFASIAVFIVDPGPIFFAQERIGRNGRNFRCLKLRSMVTNADEVLAHLLANDPVAAAEWNMLHKLKKDPRVTPIGRFLRSSSIDELPQFWNVLMGDMSLVGPRPIVPKEAERYGNFMRHYCTVKPGLTGLWQVSGRNDTTYRRRIALDVAYSRHRSLKLDIWIMLRTIPAIFLSKGCY